MNKYVALLRAINVRGHMIMKMQTLRRIFESLGLDNVQTYIQSGNIIFESEEDDTALLETRIESQLEKATGDKIKLFVRTMREVSFLQQLYREDPQGSCNDAQSDNHQRDS